MLQYCRVSDAIVALAIVVLAKAKNDTTCDLLQ